MILESFSIWLKSPKIGSKSLPRELSTKRKDDQGRDLALMFGDLSRREKLLVIRPPVTVQCTLYTVQPPNCDHSLLNYFFCFLGQTLPHLVGNCHQEKPKTMKEKSHVGDLWLQMGADHCVKVQRAIKKSWIKAQQLCQKNYKGHLVALHNAIDEKLVQNLVFNR